MIHFGQMKCGKVDQFGKLFHVVSDFFHVNFIPLIPLRSNLVLTRSPLGREETPVAIRMSFKSVVLAWLRTVLVLLVLFNCLSLVRNLWHLVVIPRVVQQGQAALPEASWNAVLNPLWLIIGFSIFFGLTYRFSKASWPRAVELAAVVGLTEEDLDAHLTRLRFPEPIPVAEEYDGD